MLLVMSHNISLKHVLGYAVQHKLQIANDVLSSFAFPGALARQNHYSYCPPSAWEDNIRSYIVLSAPGRTI